MRTIFTFFILFLGTICASSQTPEGIIYQAEARDNMGSLIANENLDVKITILEDDANGLAVWKGLHNVTTNKFGMFVVVIGAGENIGGSLFDEIGWSSHPHFLNVQVKRSTSSFWINMGTTQFLSVPYALHAKTATALVQDKSLNLKSAKTGVPSQTWSLFGNSNTNPKKDRIGTTDNADLVFITDNVERLRITTEGKLITADGVGLEVGGNFAVHGDSTYIDKDLYVGRDVYLNDNDKFSPRGETFNFGDFTVENMSATYLTGTLSVDGETDFNNELRVNEGSTTTLSGMLTVDKETFLNSSLAVKEITSLQGRLYVEGNSKFSTDVNVDGKFTVNSSKFVVDNISGNTGLAGNLTANGNGTFANLTIKGTGATKGEHVALFENSAGGNGDGIAIKINKEETTDENNFITFYRKDIVAGRVEGYHHNLGDKPAIIANLIEPMVGNTGHFLKNTLGFTTPFTIKFGTLPSLSGGSWPSFNAGSLPDLRPGHMSTGSLPSLNFKNASFPKLNAGEFPSFSNNGEKITDLIQPWKWFKPNWSSMVSDKNNPVYKIFAEAYENDWKTLTDMGITELFIKAAELEIEANIKSEGVTYGSKGADYAEWLPRTNKDDKLTIGQVVGVTGGKVSLNTDGADQILVISSKPIVLGNLPEKGKEDLNEKVAFLGQVPTWVKGNVEVGDYIIASGRNDGTGIAVSPENLEMEQICDIVGRAWSASGNSMISLINVAIGLNRNDMAGLILKQQERLNGIEAKLNEIENRLTGFSTADK